jgi:hypothetical protein
MAIAIHQIERLLLSVVPAVVGSRWVAYIVRQILSGSQQGFLLEKEDMRFGLMYFIVFPS